LGLMLFLGVTPPAVHCRAATPPPVSPTRIVMTYPDPSLKGLWIVPVRAAGGARLYTLTRTFEHSMNGDVTGIDILLEYSGDSPFAPNLLSPVTDWHGMQPFIFAAGDLVNGPEKSAYGQQRTIPVPKLGLQVSIRIISAQVSRPAANELRLDELQLEIEIGNASTLPHDH
jgi:hypothetical protein